MVATAVVLAGGALGVGWVVLRGGPDEDRPRPARKAERYGKIAFASRGAGAYYRIHVINADGTRDVTLTSGFGEQRVPAWSPDGDRIAFVQDPDPRGPSDRNTDVYVMNADGTGVARVVSSPSAEGDPSWSPDGSRLAFFSMDTSTGRSRISVTSLDRSDRIDLSQPPEDCNDREPAWSPDGITIAFTRQCGFEPSGVYLMDARGSGVIALAEVGRTPDWSPDGSRILYTGSGPVGPSVYVINADGTGNRMLTDGSSAGDPEWSRDGNKIVFTMRDGLALDLYIMNADGTGTRRLTAGPGNAVTASW